MNSADPVSRLIFELSKLPGVGEKTATRLAYFILRQSESYTRSLADALIDARMKTGLCRKCFTFTDQETCAICNSVDRDTSVLCVVEKPADVLSIERTTAFRGYYHVLHGVLSPLDGVGPEELKIRELTARIGGSDSGVREVIFATNPSVEGEATALYLHRLLKPFGVKVTRLAHGIPVGGTLEYSDRQTIGKALENRMEMN